MFSIELDIVHTSGPEMVNQFAAEHNCVAELIQLNGPGGGNPIYKFSSNNLDSLSELLDEYMDEPTDIDDFLI